jgi:hypothetical protein
MRIGSCPTAAALLQKGGDCLAIAPPLCGAHWFDMAFRLGLGLCGASKKGKELLLMPLSADQRIRTEGPLCLR